MGYTKHIIKGVSWIAAIRVVIRILSFAKTIIIARILSPNDFGIFGIATLVLTFVEIFTETGVNIFLVQKKATIDEYIDTAWVVSILRGFIIALVIIASSFFVVSFFNSPQSLGVLILISLVPIGRGFINPSIIKFQKDLKFNQEFNLRSLVFLVETISIVTFVFLLHNVYGIVIGMLIGVLMEIYLSLTIVKPLPRLKFHSQKFREVVGFGKWITASTIFNYFYQHGDDIAVGRLLGTSSLGIYDMAYRLSLIPLSDISDVVSKVTFPVYVQLSDDMKRLRRAFLRTFLAVVGLVVPISLVLFFYPLEIVTLLLGTKWLEVVPVLQVLAIFGAVRAFSVFLSSLFLSVKMQRAFTLVTFVGLVGLGITVVPFVQQWGMIGAGLAALSGTLLTFPLILYYLYKIFTRKTINVEK